MLGGVRALEHRRVHQFARSAGGRVVDKLLEELLAGFAFGKLAIDDQFFLKQRSRAVGRTGFGGQFLVNSSFG